MEERGNKAEFMLPLQGRKMAAVQYQPEAGRIISE